MKKTNNAVKRIISKAVTGLKNFVKNHERMYAYHCRTFRPAWA